MTEPLKIDYQQKVLTITFNRPNQRNAINSEIIFEFERILNDLPHDIKALVLRGDESYFCFGADFDDIDELYQSRHVSDIPVRLFDIWNKISNGPFTSIAVVEGKVNAGGLGFVAACDIVLSSETATFSLSEMLFGLFPACVMPFMMRKTGPQACHYMSLATRPIDASRAKDWGLVDAIDNNIDILLRQHLIGARRLSAKAIGRYKRYMNRLIALNTHEIKSIAVEANREIFSDQENIQAIKNYQQSGLFPWETP
ncbi:MULTISPECIES: enoyl-CoA hydratase/isomerase [unclassified Pseudoalteromonas]|uniref:enoyl-CoA hydratase/isomerase n=1 Tax=unclassified Pseudoalteromonas TaxID=194690 RepID=UPI0025B57AF7|nr:MULTISPECIES: enoyl-CoA hydratase/isomerase [unclassified Pseudoalteromonas]MDN3379150.1 enoyl-CoA hydratase/isomerase [Pseudoalteromonas sp. APC 3893]MDN3387645.1 enoyl-CoA hydratase/isomerase [Pseudoalteromonas sp. APC 4017]